MAWRLRWGSWVKAVEARAKRGRSVPSGYTSRPRLKEVDAPFIDAFYTLSAARASGMGGVNPIPISEVLAYLTLVGIASAEQRSKYLRLIQRLDSTYLTHMAEKAEQNKPS